MDYRTILTCVGQSDLFACVCTQGTSLCYFIPREKTKQKTKNPQQQQWMGGCIVGWVSKSIKTTNGENKNHLLNRNIGKLRMPSKLQWRRYRLLATVVVEVVINISGAPPQMSPRRLQKALRLKGVGAGVCVWRWVGVDMLSTYTLHYQSYHTSTGSHSTEKLRTI